jgi:ATP-dependent 26S proteasome regulatory subunit
MDLSQLKTQIMTIFMMKSNDKDDTGKMTMIYAILWSYLSLTILEWASKSLPIFIGGAIELGRQWISKKYEGVNSLLPVNKETIVNSLTIKRTYTNDKSDESNPNVERVDSIINFLCNLDNTRHIKLHNRYILNTNEEIIVAPNIKAIVNNIKLAENGDINQLEIKIFSEKYKVSELRKWMEEIYENYKIEKKNNLGNKKFYFNEVPIEPAKAMEMDNMNLSKLRGVDIEKIETAPKVNYRWESAPKTLTFTMNEFNTSKSLGNVFGSHVSELKDRIDLFLNNPEWYSQRGIPYSLGILLHGIPGAGKTSTIKGIAKDTNRHIFNLSLRPFTTQKQLMNLFFNDNVTVMNGEGTKITINIPLNQRIYVIEDIDCLTDVVLDREENKKKTENSGEAITLAFLLNLLDGVLETPGRILIITSNFPEKLDKALIRPGRIDVNIGFTFANKDLIVEMINNFYSISLTVEDLPEEIEEVLTPAEIIECLCCYYRDYNKAISRIVSKVKERKDSMMTEIKRTLNRQLSFEMEPDIPIDTNEISSNEIINSDNIEENISFEINDRKKEEVSLISMENVKLPELVLSSRRGIAYHINTMMKPINKLEIEDIPIELEEKIPEGQLIHWISDCNQLHLNNDETIGFLKNKLKTYKLPVVGGYKNDHDLIDILLKEENEPGSMYRKVAEESLNKQDDIKEIGNRRIDELVKNKLEMFNSKMREQQELDNKIANEYFTKKHNLVDLDYRGSGQLYEMTEPNRDLTELNYEVISSQEDWLRKRFIQEQEKTVEINNEFGMINEDQSEPHGNGAMNWAAFGL